MDPGTITLDRDSFKALASEVRVEILKQLEARRMTVTDLSHMMSLAKPTLLLPNPMAATRRVLKAPPPRRNSDFGGPIEGSHPREDR